MDIKMNNNNNMSFNSAPLKENLPPGKPVRTKLYVSNFPENSTRRSLTEFFSKFGQVLECAIMWDKYAFIHYGTMEEAQNALKKANNMYFMGQKLFIQLSTSRNRQSCNWYQQEAEKLLAKVQSNTGDTSFMSSSSSSNLIETKLYVTNLPDNCNQQELKSLFEKYGEVLECVIMWNHYAFIHFADFTEAKTALDNLNGTTFNGKQLIVQLSTSSNRPLPKCLAFSKSNTSISSIPAHQQNNKNNSIVENSSESSILCYRASDIEKSDSQHDLKSSNEKNWIQIIKNGCLPIAPSHSATTTVNQSNSNENKCFDLNKFFNLNQKTSQVLNEITNKEKISLSVIPTPEMPDLSLKIPGVKKETDLLKNIDMNNSLINFDQIPTPPMPDDLLKTENDSLKKLIQNINSSVLASKPEQQPEDESNKNEKILIDRLNLLKYENNFDDNKIKSLWNIDENSQLISLSSSSGVSTSSSVRSLSPPGLSNSCYTIDYLNKKCVYEENLIKNNNEFLYKTDDRHGHVSYLDNKTVLSNLSQQQTSVNNFVKKSRCTLVNYLLFPEVKEESFGNKNDYETILIDMIKKNCIFD